MAQNLNYDVLGKCYNNNTENCDKYGRLYDWNTAITVCPSGCHLPNNAEWDRLYCYADGTFNSAGYYGDWWSASENNASNAYNRYMGYNYDDVRYDDMYSTAQSKAKEIGGDAIIDCKVIKTDYLVSPIYSNDFYIGIEPSVFFVTKSGKLSLQLSPFL